jgi:signal peptidase I
MKISEMWSAICGAHRDKKDYSHGVREFFFPRIGIGFFLRLATVALIAFITFGYFLIPCIIDGASMAPTFPDSGFTFCWKGRYWFDEPERGDIVIVRFHDRVFFLKRIVALAGDTVEFRRGELFVNGVAQHEPYLHYISDWNLPPRKVSEGCFYVVGDNRSQDIQEHRFGEVSRRRITGSPLFLAK